MFCHPALAVLGDKMNCKVRFRDCPGTKKLTKEVVAGGNFLVAMEVAYSDS